MNDLIKTIETIFIEAKYNEGLFWAIPLFTTLTTLLFTKIVIIASPIRNFTNSEYRIQTSFLKVTTVIAMFAIGIISYLFNNGYYTDYAYNLSHLLALIILLTIAVWSVFQIRNAYNRDKTKDLARYAITRSELQSLNTFFVASFKTLKFWLLLPFLGFLGLLINPSEDKNLLSIVLDTSASMKEPNSLGEIPLEISKNALYNVISDLGENTDVIFTTFSEGDKKENIIGITSSSINNLLGNNIFFTGNEQESLLGFIQKMETENTDSPICETIWKNYLFTEENTANNGYTNIVSIVITDGLDYLTLNQENTLSGFFCDNSGYDNLFTTNVNIIQLESTLNPDDERNATTLFDKAASCGYYIADGTNEENYNNALSDILGNYKKDYNFLYIIFTIAILIILFGFLANLQTTLR